MPLSTRLLVSLLFLVTGGTALIYQVTWFRDLSLIFGMSHQATSIVLAAFMGGLALGGFSFGRRVHGFRRPLRVYGLIEIAVAAFAWALPGLLGGVDSLYRTVALSSDGVGPGVTTMRIVLAFAALVLPTFFMGGTLPVLVHAFVSQQREFGARFAWLYGVNTLGGVLGALAAGFVLIPALGVRDTQLAAVIVNATVGIVAVVVGSRWPRSAATSGEIATPARPDAKSDAWAPRSPAGRLERLPWQLAFLGTAVSGTCALAFEVMWTRGIGMSVGSTTYSFTVMLAAFLVGIWLGSWLHAALPLRRIPESLQFGVVLLALGLASFATSYWIPRLPETVVALNAALYGGIPRVRPGTVLLLAFLVMLVPCVFMGAAFPLAGQARARLTRRYGQSVGDTLGLNTLGSIVGSMLAGFVLIPALGLQRGMLVVAGVAAAYGALVLGAALRARAEPGRRWLVAAATGVLATCALLLPALAQPWNLERLAAFQNNAIWAYRGRHGAADLERLEELQVEYFEEGRGSTVAVIQGGGERVLLVNGKAVASDSPSDLPHELLLGHLPVLVHPEPRSALVVGLGAGITLGAVAAHDSVERLVLVEIEPAVVGAARRFASVNDDAVDLPRLEIVFQDGRNFLKTTRERFDVITADPIHPWAYGAAYLYTREYYELARSRLEPGGVMCQWLPGYELSLADFKSVVATFGGVFSHTTAWIAGKDLVLIGSDLPTPLDLGRLARRLEEPKVRRQLERVGLARAPALLAEFGMGSASVDAFAAGAVINTDDNLHLEFSTPLTMGLGSWPQIAAELAAHRSSPMEVVGNAAPRFASGEAAAEALGRYQAAKWKTMEVRFRLRSAELAAQQRGELGPELRAALEVEVERLRTLLGELPEYAPARLALADALSVLAEARLAENPRAAADLAREAVAFAPQHAAARTTLGTALLRLGLFPSAVLNLEAARDLRPDDWRIYYLLSEALTRDGRHEYAIAVLREGLDLKPDHAGMRSRLDALLARVLGRPAPPQSG